MFKEESWFLQHGASKEFNEQQRGKKRGDKRRKSWKKMDQRCRFAFGSHIRPRDPNKTGYSSFPSAR
ncbi:unnamed protein product, partial [Heterotrigona itama]